jgi:exosome complex RNA-binding protein Rrp4
MTKADIVAKISEKLGLEKGDVQATVETFMEEVKNSLESGDNVYLKVLSLKQEQKKQVETFLKTLQSKFLHTTFQPLNLLKFL